MESYGDISEDYCPLELAKAPPSVWISNKSVDMFGQNENKLKPGLSSEPGLNRVVSEGS